MDSVGFKEGLRLGVAVADEQTLRVQLLWRCHLGLEPQAPATIPLDRARRNGGVGGRKCSFVSKRVQIGVI